MSSSYLVLALVAALVAACQCKQLIFQNHMGETVWVGAQPNSGKPQVNDGGWEMAPNSETTVNVDDTWSGRFWGRTGCDGNSYCETGNCGSLQCNGTGGQPPVTLAEFTFGGWGGQDFYDISVMDGFNIQITILPTVESQGGFRCAPAQCQGDINNNCPKELQLKVGDRVVGCKSACLAFNTDQYCCRGAYNKPDTCKSSDWPHNYPQEVFKKQCPDAYSYAYDDQESTFTCENTDYKIVFG